MIWPPRILSNGTGCSDSTIESTYRLLTAMLEEPLMLQEQSKQQTVINLHFPGGMYRKRYSQGNLLRDIAMGLLEWANDFDTTRDLLELLDLSETAVEAYRQQVIAGAEAALSSELCQSTPVFESVHSLDEGRGVARC